MALNGQDVHFLYQVFTSYKIICFQMFYYTLILTYLYQTIVYWAAQLNYRNVTLKARTYIDKVKTAWKRCHGKSFKRPSSCWGSSFGKVKYCKYISQKELTLRETQRVSLHIIMLPTTLYSVLDNCHGHDGFNSSITCPCH